MTLAVVARRRTRALCAAAEEGRSTSPWLAHAALDLGLSSAWRLIPVSDCV
jgi:hypothetical protein